jgi:pyruvate formate lyase activating enzyme
MNIGGHQETSLLDYPGKIATIIWTTQCNFRCPFCYNPEIVMDNTGHIDIDYFFSFLKKRRGKLDAVSITGGEPFLQTDLKPFVKRIKKMGFLVKIDTNGSFPDKLKSLLDASLIDYVSMDVKSTKETYSTVVGVPVDCRLIDRSIHLIMDSAPDYEFKTTVIPRFHTEEDIKAIAEWIRGSKQYFLQQFKTDTPLLSKNFAITRTYSTDKLQSMCQSIKSFVYSCNVRGV